MIPCSDLKRSFEQYKDEFEAAAIETLRSGWYILGEKNVAFEEEFARQMNSKFCISCDNATNALFLGINALGIESGDEVIVQSNTYIATVLGITRNGATPVFVEPNEFFNMDSNIDKYITNKTKAVLVTHLFGQATNMGKIKEICEKHNIFLLEDCSQAHYAEYKGKKVGTIGKIGFFSFYPTKNIGAMGDAGCMITDDEELAKKLKSLRNYGSAARYDFQLEGINSRMDEIQAALLLVRLKHSRDITQEKINIAKKYLNGINNPLVKLPKVDKDCTSVWHLFVLEVEDRERFISYLKENGVGTDVHYPIPPHLSGCYKRLGYKEGDYPIAEYYSKHIVDIPIFNGMTNEEIEKVIGVINGYK